jgi:hypothetical protein
MRILRKAQECETEACKARTENQQEEITALRNLCKKFLHPRYYHNLPSKFKLK